MVPPLASAVPSELLNAVASRRGRVTLVVGAGCSLEAPTALKLSRDYSVEVHDALVADGVLGDDECNREQREDLSLLADLVYGRSESQADIVMRLPRPRFRIARPNDGYLDAIAMMLDGAIICVLTLNYDLALTNAIKELDGGDIDVVNGPETAGDLGSKSIVYLHRNVEEPDADKWIMRQSQLDAAWQNTWEELVTSRVSASPFLVFVGLGSPAALLTQSVSRIRSIKSGAPNVFLVDPGDESPFATSLELPEGNTVKMAWCEFMAHLAKRVAHESCRTITSSAQNLCDKEDMDISAGCFSGLVDLLQSAGLRRLGRVRARWLCQPERYSADHQSTRAPLAQLLLALGEILARPDYELAVTDDGRITVDISGRRIGSVMGLHGAGVKLWAEARHAAAAAIDDMADPPDVVLATGFRGSPVEDLAPPADIVYGPDNEDLVGQFTPHLVDIESIQTAARSFVDLVPR